MLTADQAVGSGLYSSLFGWIHRDRDTDRFTYRFFKSGERRVAGIAMRLFGGGRCGGG